MPLIVKDSNPENFEPMPLGTQQGVCVFIEDIGTHDSEYMGETTRKHQIVVCWELKEKMTKGENAGRPFMISKFYTLSLNERAVLRKDLESWRGVKFTDEELKGFDLERLKGANCFLNIIEATKKNGKKYTQAASITPLMRGMEKITTINTEPPAWIDKLRQQSIELSGETCLPPEDDIPF